MKYLLTIATIFTVTISLAQSVKEGDNLKEIYKKIANPNFKAAPKVTYWKEGEGIFFIGAEPFVLIALKDTTLIGLFTRESPSGFLFDTIGNSTLSLSSHVFTFPYWIIKRNAKVSSSDETILKLMEELYSTTLQANDGQPTMEIAQRLNEYRTDTNLYNRHIAFLLDSYQQLILNSASNGIKPPANIALPTIKKLTEECLLVFGKVPPLVCIYMGEALLSAGMTNEARKHFKESLQQYPNSVPLLVYNYRLEEDDMRKKEELKELKKEHRKHWMVKDL